MPLVATKVEDMMPGKLGVFARTLVLVDVGLCGGIIGLGVLYLVQIVVLGG